MELKNTEKQEHSVVALTIEITKAEFEAWTRDAEQKREAALEPYARAESEEERQRIVAEVEEYLNRL